MSKVEKLKIQTFNSRTRNGAPQDDVSVKFNPETYSISYSNSFNESQGINTSSRCAIYAHSDPQSLSFRVILDTTEGYFLQSIEELSTLFVDNIESVYKKAEDFLDKIGRMDGNLHEPKFLKLIWGDLVFDCRLQSANINYSSFHHTGVPTRAEIDCSFIADTSKEKRLKKENKSSPDLTHKRIMKAEDNLLALTREIYGSAKHYLVVANFNNLDNFRNIPPGTELQFPPIKK